MNEVSKQHYNTLMNNLFQCAGKYYAMSFSFKIGGMNGFCKMAREESHERWELGDKIAKHLTKYMEEPVIAAAPAMSQKIGSPAEALNIAIQHEKVISDLVEKALVHATQNDPGQVYMLSKIQKKCMNEHNEIDGFQKKMALQGQTIASMDSFLYDKYKWYGPKNEKQPMKAS